MSQRLALGIIPGIGWRAREIQTISQQAEGEGFQAIFATEVNNDVLATVQLMGAATSGSAPIATATEFMSPGRKSGEGCPKIESRKGRHPLTQLYAAR